jgi:hypothetical protein
MNHLAAVILNPMSGSSFFVPAHYSNISWKSRFFWAGTGKKKDKIIKSLPPCKLDF